MNGDARGRRNARPAFFRLWPRDRRVLLVLLACSGPASAGEIAGAAQVGRGRAIRAAVKLESVGWAVAVGAPGPVLAWQLTGRGRECAARNLGLGDAL